VSGFAPRIVLAAAQVFNSAPNCTQNVGSECWNGLGSYLKLFLGNLHNTMNFNQNNIQNPEPRRILQCH